MMTIDSTSIENPLYSEAFSDAWTETGFKRQYTTES